MPYSQFDIESIKVNFNITLIERVSKFADVVEISYSDYLAETLRFNTPIALAINSEKSR
ncbi:hypothetical protein [Tolypothrix sp. VBCCA 56010]|uniref:hypothetical protein n=1 Tax=Tolypothrix sp. VBCCA 56010 TaxID=3137731 RepID=UPI003D7E2858